MSDVGVSVLWLKRTAHDENTTSNVSMSRYTHTISVANFAFCILVDLRALSGETGLPSSSLKGRYGCLCTNSVSCCRPKKFRRRLIQISYFAVGQRILFSAGAGDLFLFPEWHLWLRRDHSSIYLLNFVLFPPLCTILFPNKAGEGKPFPLSLPPRTVTASSWKTDSRTSDNV